MASSYTDLDQQRTRVVPRADGDTPAATQASSIGNTQLIPREKPGLLEGISLAQIIAGAAAAATSMVLASHIGIGGSVIGAAVSSVVTVVSSQLYRRFLDASAEKLKRGGAVVREEVLPGARRGTQATGAPTDDATRVMPMTQTAGDTPVRGARVAPRKLQARAAAERAATQHKVVAFSAAVAVAAVALCAAVILLTTAGAGIGTKTTSLFAPATVEDASSVAPTTGTGTNSAPADDSVPDTEAVSPETPSSATGTTGDGGAATTPTTPDTGGTGTGDNATGSTGDTTGGSSGTGTGNEGSTGDSTGTSSDSSTSGTGTTGGTGTGGASAAS